MSDKKCIRPRAAGECRLAVVVLAHANLWRCKGISRAEVRYSEGARMPDMRQRKVRKRKERARKRERLIKRVRDMWEVIYGRCNIYETDDETKSKRVGVM